MAAIEKPKTGTDIRLRLDNLVKKFPQRSGSGEFVAVNGVSLNIESGEFVTLLGPSGCGKTTTLRLIAGFEMPSSGRILLDGQDMTNLPPNKRDMALVFQNYALFPHMSVYDNVAYGLETRGMKRQAIKVQVDEALKVMGLAGLEDRRPNQLSGGQQQRVALARSLVMEPRILLFDEPLSNLDAKLRVQMRSEIHRLQRRLSITSIYVTHDQIEAMALSDRVVVMNAGIIEQMGTPEEIYRRPVTRFVADFIGRANFIALGSQRHDSELVEISLFGMKYHLPVHFPYTNGDNVVAMLRPEALMLRADPSLPQAFVEQTMYLGAEVEYIVNLDGHRLVIVQTDPRTSQIFSEGQEVGVDVITEALHLLPED